MTLASGGRMPRETVSPLILLALESGPTSGAAVARWIAERTAGGYKPGAGSIYPRLGTLELRGLVTYESRPGKQGRAYSLTDAGRAALAANRAKAKNTIRSLRKSAT